MRLFVVLLTTLMLSSAHAQVDSLTWIQYNKAKGLVESSSYDEANKAFLAIMHPNKTLPDELCFFFGQSLKETGYVLQSKQLLRKYLQLVGRKGEHWVDARRMIAELEGRPFFLDSAATTTIDVPTDGSDPEHAGVNDSIPDDHMHHPNDPCDGQEYVRCPICHGSGVIVTKGTFGNYYTPCPYSNERGLMDCYRYKEYLNGHLIEVDE